MFVVEALTGLGRCKLWFLFLLQLKFCSCNKESRDLIVKTISKEDDFTPACSNVTQHLIAILVCRVRPERSREEECHLIYRKDQGSEHKCDSRFSLMTVNQTMFLHLSNLTTENSGNYTCDCSYKGGIFTLLLNITVEEKSATVSPTEVTPHEAGIVVIGVPVLIFIIIIAVVILGVWRIRRHRSRREAMMTTEQNTETASVEPYSIFMQKQNSLYLTSISHTTTSRNHLNLAGTDNRGFGAPL